MIIRTQAAGRQDSELDRSRYPLCRPDLCTTLISRPLTDLLTTTRGERQMAHCAQQFVLLVATAMLSSYLVCQLVSGIALNQAEGIYAMDTKPISVEGNTFWMDNGEAIELFPVSEPHFEVQFNNSRRKLGTEPFMSCYSCTCCDSAGTTCLSVPCCFTINCSVQPYGFCKFVPMTCNCQGCTW